MTNPDPAVRQVVQSLRSSTTEVVDGLARRPGPGHVLVRSMASVVSAGTERMLVEFARAGLVGKVRQQPERARELGDKVRADGVMSTLDAVRSRLDEPVPLGYANAGRVVAAGPGVTEIEVGDLVASNGPHAELVVVPATLCAVVPEGVPAEEAAFASLASVALQGIRLAEPTLGERFVVTGLGLIGLLAVQLLRAHGCEVLGVDVDPARVALGARLGAETVLAEGDPVEAASQFSRGRGVDGVILTASTKSSAPVHEAAEMCRKRGRIVLVGVTGLELQRSDFYAKELSFRVSCSYGPGRYDPSYEERATDYPLGFVRWTAGRNLEAVLDMMATGRLDIGPLITHRFPLAAADEAYHSLTDDSGALGIVIEYPPAEDRPIEGLLTPTLQVTPVPAPPPVPTGDRVGIVGAGRFATQTMIPALKAAGAQLVVVASSGGVSAAMAARKFEIGQATNDAASVVEDPDVDLVFVLSRHDSHAALAQAALDAGKHVFVEKPLAIDEDGLARVVAAWERRAGGSQPPSVGIGFNRRFAPITTRMMALLDTVPVPRAITMTINAGAVPADHWVQDPQVGGGRLVGEACHFIDLARHLAGSAITDVSVALLERPGPPDSAVITLRHEGGSVSTIGYFANGSKRFPKEQITVFAGGRVLVNHNFRTLKGYGWPRFRTVRLRRQDKGHAAGVEAFLASVRAGSPPPIPFDQIVEVSAATLLAARQG